MPGTLPLLCKFQKKKGQDALLRPAPFPVCGTYFFFLNSSSSSAVEKEKAMRSLRESRSLTNVS